MAALSPVKDEAEDSCAEEEDMCTPPPKPEAQFILERTQTEPAPPTLLSEDGTGGAVGAIVDDVHGGEEAAEDSSEGPGEGEDESYSDEDSDGSDGSDNVEDDDEEEEVVVGAENVTDGRMGLSPQELNALFTKALKFSQQLMDGSNKEIVCPNKQKLAFYGLFKQAAKGNCMQPRPNSEDGQVALAKWEAWNSNKGLARDQAMARFVSQLDAVAPAWDDSDQG